MTTRKEHPVVRLARLAREADAARDPRRRRHLRRAAERARLEVDLWAARQRLEEQDRAR